MVRHSSNHANQSRRRTARSRTRAEVPSPSASAPSLRAAARRVNRATSQARRHRPTPPPVTTTTARPSPSAATFSRPLPGRRSLAPRSSSTRATGRHSARGRPARTASIRSSFLAVTTTMTVTGCASLSKAARPAFAPRSRTRPAPLPPTSPLTRPSQARSAVSAWRCSRRPTPRRARAASASRRCPARARRSSLSPTERASRFPGRR